MKLLCVALGVAVGAFVASLPKRPRKIDFSDKVVPLFPRQHATG